MKLVAKDLMDSMFFTNHARVLCILLKNPEIILRIVSVEIGITERAIQRIVADLEREGYLKRYRDGRRNGYTFERKSPFSWLLRECEAKR